MKIRPADKILTVLLALVLLIGVAGSFLGIWVIGDDLETQGEFLDGIGVMIGVAMLAVVGIPMALSAKALHALHRGNPAAWKWAVATGVAGVVLGIPFGMFWQPLFAVLVLPLLVAVVAVEGRERAS